jgi:ribonuclease HII
MIEDTLQKLENRLAQSKNLNEENRKALQELVKNLRLQIDALDDDDRAESIAGFTETSTREALRVEQDQDLLDIALDGLQKSTREFEATYPKLTAVVNTICQQLSNLGI